MLMCNKCIEPVRVKKKALDDGKTVRICAKCSEIIDA
jgi:large subunit ribosomal protein L24